SLDSGDPFLKAFAKASAAEGLVAAALSKLISGSAYQGTEDTGTVANPLDKNGGRLMIIHDHERIVREKDNQKLGEMSNEELVQNAMFASVYKPSFDAANVTTTFVKKSTRNNKITHILNN